MTKKIHKNKTQKNLPAQIQIQTRIQDEKQTERTSKTNKVRKKTATHLKSGGLSAPIKIHKRKRHKKQSDIHEENITNISSLGQINNAELLDIFTQSDPFAQREQAKYDHPIPSREFIMQCLSRLGMPVTASEIIQLLKLQDAAQQEAMRYRLKAMQRDGQLIVDRQGKLVLVSKVDLFRGRVIAHPNGYGFLSLIENPTAEELFINPRQMRKLLTGDQVLACKSIDFSGREEAIIVEVLAHGIERVIGFYHIEHGVALVKPINSELATRTFLIAPNKNKSKSKRTKAQEGDIVVAKILEYPDNHLETIVEIQEVWGQQLTPKSIIRLVLQLRNIDYEWPDAAEQENQMLAAETLANPVKHNQQSRVDLRHLPFVTIDGEDSKDYDDAVVALPDPATPPGSQPSNWKLYVAIADVAHYVTPDSALDQEARRRGTSIYFPNYVAPMLPSLLSDQLCSLRPRCDRYALVVEMQINARGKITSYNIYEAIIRSLARLTYDQVYQYLEQQGQPEQTAARRKPWGNAVVRLHRLYQLLAKQRRLRGAIAFKRLEAQITFDKQQGQITAISSQLPHYVHAIIEECMLAANVSVADFLIKHHAPALFRVHEAPSLDKLTQVQQFLSLLQVKFQWQNSIQPKDYAMVLTKISQRPSEQQNLINLILLRSMKQAVYSFEDRGHFALSFAHYLHFTSPIRRYPDLFNHRLVKLLLKHPRYFTGSAAQQRRATWQLPTLAEQCSTNERRADEAERSVMRWHKAQFISHYLGQMFTGTISGVANFGFFVELDNLLIEGMVHVSTLPADYYHLEGTYQRLIGSRRGLSFCLGDRVTVRVSQVKVMELEIYLELLECRGQAMTTDDNRRRGKGKKNKSKTKTKVATKKNRSNSKSKIKTQANKTKKSS